MSRILSGTEVKKQILAELNQEIVKLKNRNVIPTLVIIQIGDNSASNTYVKNKIKLSEQIGTVTILKKFSESFSENELLSLIDNLNDDKSINGIILQLPIPKHINEEKILSAISPEKDVDCFNIVNIGKLWSSKNTYIKPCTPFGIVEILKRNRIEIARKNVTIVGRSNIVGKPLACLLLLENATVTICHSQTENLSSICKKSDILISAIGKPKFITKEFVNEKMVVIDVGMNLDENNKLCGDVDFEGIKDIVKYITPVPGGVGPMTVTILLRNLIHVTKKQNNLF